MKNYTIISGTGRAGTTLLVRILTKAGLDTGFDAEHLSVDPVSNAGLELDIRTKPDCSIVKTPYIATYIDQVFADGEIAIDHAIICIRKLHDAAESRRRIQVLRHTDESVPGGLWGVSAPGDQETYLKDIFYRLIFHLTRHEVPMTFLHFPRFATDAAYAVRELSKVFPNIDPERLRSAYQSEVVPELIHFPDQNLK
jgi:hypothetical protein